MLRYHTCFRSFATRYHLANDKIKKCGGKSIRYCIEEVFQIHLFVKKNTAVGNHSKSLGEQF